MGQSSYSLFTAAQLDGEDDEEKDGAGNQSQAFKNRDAVKDKINFNVKSISIDIVEDLNITGEVGRTLIDSKAKYVRTMQELDTTFMAFCAKMLGGKFEKVSIKTLAIALKESMEELFETFETDAVKIIQPTKICRHYPACPSALYPNLAGTPAQLSCQRIRFISMGSSC